MLDARFPLVILLLVTLFSVRAQQFGPVIDELPPGVTQCGNLQISWLGGVPPYFFSIVDPSSGKVLLSLEQTISRSFFGKINIPAETTIIFRVTDSTGTTSFSKSIVVQNGEGNSCFGQPEGGTSVMGYTSLPPSQATTFQTPLSPSPPSSAPPPLNPAAISSSFISSQSTTPPSQSTAPPSQSTAPPSQSTTPLPQSTFPPSQSTPPPSQSTPLSQSTFPPSQSASPPFSISSPSSTPSQPSSASFISQSTTIQGPSSSSLSSSTTLLSQSGSLTTLSSSLTTSQPTNVSVAIPSTPTTESPTVQGSNLPPSTPMFPSSSQASTSSFPPSTSTSRSSSDNSSAASGNRNATIARVIAGVLAAVLLITVAAYLLLRRRARRLRDEIHTMESQDGPRLLQRVQQAVRDSPGSVILSFPLPPDTLPSHRRDDRRQASSDARDALGTDGEPAAWKDPPGTPTLMVRPDKLRLSDP